MKVERIEIKWNKDMSIFAAESYLKSVGDEYGWLGGIDDTGKMHCILPYTIIKRSILRMARFRIEPIAISDEFTIDKEKMFLNSAMEYFRDIGVDTIIPGSNNAIFRTYPDGACAAPYGSYVLDLRQSEEMLWKNISKKTRQNINSAKRSGVAIRDAGKFRDDAYKLIVGTFKRSKLPFMSGGSFKRIIDGLGENGKIMMAEYEGVAQSYIMFAVSNYCAYAIYGGNVEGQQLGAQKLLIWEAIRSFSQMGVKKFDFYGARINPDKGSKQDSINSIKRHFGAILKRGFIWRYSINRVKHYLYCLGARLRSGGDIVDAERHKLDNI